MAVFIFDGTKSVTATKADQVIITADLASFTSAAESGGNSVLSFGANTITVTGVTLTNANLSPVIQVPGGTFRVIDNAGTPFNTANNLVINGGLGAGTDFTGPTASSKTVFVGGLNLNDSADGAEAVNIGGKGTFLVYSNGGDDIVGQLVAFDSTSNATVYGGAGNDTVALTSLNVKATITVFGGAGVDDLRVQNTAGGSVTIYGGTGVNDSADAKDAILIGPGGTWTVYGNGGDDSIINGVAFDSTAVATIYGGVGNDTVNLAAAGKANVTIFGNAGTDQLTLGGNTGSTTIYGGNGVNDSADGADTITVNNNSGVINVYGNGGADTISGTGLLDTTTVASFFGGAGNDTINVGMAGGVKGSITVFGGGDSDVITVTADAAGSSTTVYGGSSINDSADAADTITIGAGAKGTITIYGNGGNDSIDLAGVAMADASTSVSVFGGVGKDTISMGTGAVDGKASFTLTGGDGADTYAIKAGTGQTITITDFAAGSDVLKITTGTAGTITPVVAASAATLQQALDAAATGAAGKATAVVFQGSTYVIVNDGANGFAAATDQAIKLTGVTDLLGLVAGAGTGTV